MKLPVLLRHRVRRDGERGYILLTLLLMVALMAFVAMVTLPTLKFDLQRDREQEMIHRGVQYSNAIRRYYKKFGRYPTKVEDLLSSNNIKFLRKQYKDPMNCKAGKCQDFKLLYFSDVQTSISGFGGGMIPGANPIGGAAGGLNGANGAPFGQNSSFGGGNNSFGGGNNSFGGNSGFGGNSSFGQNSNSSFGQNQAQTQQNQPSQGNPPAGTDSTQTGDQAAGNNGNSGNTNGPGGASGTTSSSPFGTGQIIGGPIVGVASATKITDPTIREFNHKKKYKDWLFVYDPAQDKGQLITTPYQPQMIGSQGIPNVNGVSGGSVGQPMPGMQNNPNLPGGGGFGNSNMNGPSSSPQQQ